MILKTAISNGAITLRVKSSVQTISFYSLMMILVQMCGVVFAEDQPWIKIIYPKKDQTVYASRETFVIGHVTKPVSKLSLNGVPVEVHPSGGFLVMSPVTYPVTELKFIIGTHEGQELAFTHTFNIFKAKTITETELDHIEQTSLMPHVSTGVLKGETVYFECKSKPSQKIQVVVTADETKWQIPLQSFSKNGIAGYYGAKFSFDMAFRNATVVFECTSLKNIKKVESQATLTVLNEHECETIQVLENKVKARYKPQGGYQMFLHKGQNFIKNGWEGKWVRLKLNSAHNVFVEENQVKSEKNLNYELYPFQIGNIFSRQNKNIIELNVSMNGKPAFVFEEFQGLNQINCRLFGTQVNTDRMNLENFTLLTHVSMRQILYDTTDFSFQFPFKPYWGHDVNFLNNKMQFLFRMPPEENMKVCLDAGHGPDSGALGPLGKSERDLLMPLVERVGALLEKHGYTVVYTRKNASGMALYDRAEFATLQNADVFLSFHYNATGDGVNPYNHRGTETYYFNQAGRYLAEKMHPHLLNATGIKDGGIRFGNLAVLRNDWVPSVLMELDYILIPSAEERMEEVSFMDAVSHSILNGLNEWRTDFKKDGLKKEE